MRVLLYNEYNIRTPHFLFYEGKCAGQAGCCVRCRSTDCKRERFPHNNTENFRYERKEKPYELEHYYGFKL